MKPKLVEKIISSFRLEIYQQYFRVMFAIVCSNDQFGGSERVSQGCLCQYLSTFSINFNRFVAPNVNLKFASNRLSKLCDLFSRWASMG
jgi:hypothetical protein